MDDTVIDFDPERARFIIAAPPWSFDIVQKLPNRRWDKRRRVWLIPAVARNIDILHKSFGGARWTGPAKDALMESANGAQERQRHHGEFPKDHKFKRLPWNHQAGGLNHAYGQPASALFMDPRTGKTKVVIDLFSRLYREGRIEAALITCPMSVRESWIEALAIDCPIDYDVRVLVTTDSVKRWTREVSATRMKWLIASIESFSQGGAAAIAGEFVNLYKAAMAVDESSRIKNHSARCTKACLELSRHVEPRLILTGTSITKGLIDLYSQFEFLDPSIIGCGDFWSFRNRYAVMGGYNGKQIVGYQNQSELMALISPHIYEVRKADVLPDIPDKIRQRRTVEMAPAQNKAYSSVESGFDLNINNEEVLVRNVLERMLRKQQITSNIYSIRREHPWKKHPKTGLPVTVSDFKNIVKTSPKVQEVINLSEDYPGAMIVWSRFRPEIEWVANALRHCYGDNAVVEFHGGVDEEQRRINRHRFQDGSARFLVGNQATGGIGIELSAAEVVAYMSNTFELEDRIQSEERPMSANLKHKVLEVDIVARWDGKKTVDDIVLQSLSDKLDLAEYVRRAVREHRLEPLGL